MSYYMLFGGTNFGDTAPQNITTSYDYSAPIREIGGVGEKYQRVAAIGAMLKEHGEQLARAVSLPCEAATDQKAVTVAARRSEDGTFYLFFRSNDHTKACKGTAKIVVHFGETVSPEGKSSFAHTFNTEIPYDLEPFGSRILPIKLISPDEQSKTEWLPGKVAEIKRPTDGLPASVKLTQALTKPDPGPVKWEPLKDGQSLEQMGIYDRRFVFYRTHLNMGGNYGPLTNPIFNVVGPARDNLLTFVGGTIDPAISRTGGHRATKIGGGDNAIGIIYENVGQPNGGRGMEEMSGIRKIGKLVIQGDVSDWRMTKITRPKGRFRPERLKEVAEGFDDKAWPRLKIESDDDATQLDPAEDAVFRGSVDLTAEQIKPGDLTIQLTRRDDEGWVFVNGNKVGEGHQWDGTFTFPATGLHAGTNTIAVVIHNESGPGGLGLVKLLTPDEKIPGLPIEIGTESTGFAGQWWKNDLDEAGWATTAIGQPAADMTKLQWSRLKFELPEVKKGIWVPWVARLHVTGNGFLYLNNHALGRYWNVGPQHDFFLPECWLNFGPGKSNVLTMCLRSVDGKAVQIDSAEIVPVNEVAEFRP
jgi:hypothetical protein